MDNDDQTPEPDRAPGKPKRRIPVSFAGRMKFRRGEKHALDVQFEAAREEKDRLDQQAARLLELLPVLHALEQWPQQLEQEEQVLTTFLNEHYNDFKHVEHITATLLIMRRKRALARLNAAEAALLLLQDLLAPDPLIPELIELLQERPRAVPEAEFDREQLTGKPHQITNQFAQVKHRLQAIRTALSRGNGWIDRFFLQGERMRAHVPDLLRALDRQRKRNIPIPPEILARFSPEVIACIINGLPIPEQYREEIWEAVIYGPYENIRFREEGVPHAPIYTISLGKEDVEIPEFLKSGLGKYLKRSYRHVKKRFTG